MRVFRELKKRRVLQTAALYFAGAWGATEILSYLIERIPVFPAWADTAIAILFVLGFPVTVFLAWMFDVGTDGVRRADPTSGIGKGVIVLAVVGLLAATGGLSYLIWPRVQAERGIAMGDLGTVAVLPFENLTGDPSLGYLGMGLAEDLRQRLALFTDLKVIGRVSMAGFAMGGTDLASVRGLLDAGLVVEGSLQKPAGQLRVNVALLETATGRQIWSNTFNTDVTGWDPLRQRILQTVGEQLAVTVRLREQETPIPNEALEAYLRGLSELSAPEVADGWFDEATRAAPGFADAWARRALLREDWIWHGYPRARAWDEGREFITQARALEPDNLMADIAEAQLSWWARLDAVGSLDILRRAEQRTPNHSLVLAGLGTVLRYLPGGKEEAEAYHRRYLAQDPLNPDAHTRLAASLFFLRRMEESIVEVDRALDLDPGFSRAWEYKVNFQEFGNRPADALVTLTQRGRMEGQPSDITQQCKLSIAAFLLPLDRAVALLEDGIRRGVGMMQSHAWCPSALGALRAVYKTNGREEEWQTAQDRYRGWVEQSGAEEAGMIEILVDQGADSDCATELCRIESSLGDEGMAAWLGPEPPLTYFTFTLAADLSEALMNEGREGEARRLAAIAAPVAVEYAGPVGQPSVTEYALRLLIVSGDIDGAIEYALQVGPKGFSGHGAGLRFNIKHPKLVDDPRWQAFLDECDRRRAEEVDKFDRLVTSGDIVMP